MAKLTIPARPTRGNDASEKVRDVLAGTDEPRERFSASFPAKDLEGLVIIKAKSVNKISVNDLVIEAVQDLITKYRSGSGKYPIRD